ncbi:MAG TPA: hypothetical protein DEQ43_02875, partial [Nocardioides bacterium]|nr:hypothetical protein [Nocardioides sp.]
MTTSFPPEDRDSGPDGTNGTDENSIPEGTPSATDRDPLSGVEQPDLGHQHQPAGPTPDILDLIAQFATAKGVPPNKLFNALQSLGLDSPRMTLREAVEKVWDELADWTKGKALQRLLDGEAMTIVAGELVQGFAGLGDVPIDEITTARLQCLQKDIRRYVGAIEAAQHRAAQRLARSYDGRDFGHGAERTFVETTTRVFAVLTYRGFVDINPAAALGGGRTGLRKPKPAVLRRAAEDTEINNAFQVVYLECYDYELDAFYWQALLRSGARRAGMLGLRLGGIDLKNCELTTHQKYGVAHTRPVARSILRGIRDLAIARGAESDDDFAFRMKNGKPMT